MLAPIVELRPLEPGASSPVIACERGRPGGAATRATGDVVEGRGARTTAAAERAIAVSRGIGYRYDVDRLLTSAGAPGRPGVTLDYTFTGGATLTATTGGMVTTSHASLLGELAGA